MSCSSTLWLFAGTGSGRMALDLEIARFQGIGDQVYDWTSCRFVDSKLVAGELYH